MHRSMAPLMVNLSVDYIMTTVKVVVEMVKISFVWDQTNLCKGKPGN